MVLDPLATAQQMNDRTLGAITATSHPFLETELKAASRLIRNECRWHIAPVVEVVRKVRKRHRHEIWVPAMEITAVRISTHGGVATDLADDEFDPDTGWTAWSGDRYTLTYTAGFAEVPDDLVTLTLQIAARALGAPLGVVREQSLTSSVTWSATAPGVAGGDVLMQHELDQLAEYRIGRLP